MECFVIFVMAWCWFNATENKPQNVVGYFGTIEKTNLYIKTIMKYKQYYIEKK